MANKKYKIGQQVIIDKDITLNSMLDKKTVYKKGTKAIVCSNKWLKLPDGTFWADWFGKSDVVNEYDTENIAREVVSYLINHTALSDMLDDYDTDRKEFIDGIDVVLDDIL